jgi:exopolysaccharide biosynthesis predicted pyruvyltransferase EpsI
MSASISARLIRRWATTRLSRWPTGCGDLMARAGGAWTDPAEAEKAVLAIVPEILACSRVYTDRLHCAILSALLDRYVVLRPNSYFKNQEVFDHSLSRFVNVRFHAEALDA